MKRGRVNGRSYTYIVHIRTFIVSLLYVIEAGSFCPVRLQVLTVILYSWVNYIQLVSYSN